MIATKHAELFNYRSPKMGSPLCLSLIPIALGIAYSINAAAIQEANAGRLR